MELTFLIILGLLVLGLIFGSFINAWCWRTSQGISVAKGRSKCPHCGHALAWYDLIPLFSYLFLQGKCRYCYKAISPQYPIVELATGLLFALLYYFLSPSGGYEIAQFAILLVASILLVGAFIYDAKHMELPEKFVLPAIMLGVVSIGLKAYQGGWNSLTPQLIGLMAVVVAYTALWYFSKGRWLGAGDVRLVAIMGLFLAPAQLLIGLFVAYLAGAIYGIRVLRRSKVKRGIRVAFGPFLIIGFYIGLLWGQQIANWYLGYLQPF